MENPFWSINAGHVLTIVSMLLSGLSNRRAQSKRIDALEEKVSRMANNCRNCDDFEGAE